MKFYLLLMNITMTKLQMNRAVRFANVFHISYSYFSASNCHYWLAPC